MWCYWCGSRIPARKHGLIKSVWAGDETSGGVCCSDLCAESVLSGRYSARLLMARQELKQRRIWRAREAERVRQRIADHEERQARAAAAKQEQERQVRQVAERNLEIIRRRQEGETFAKLGQEFHLSPGRVRQIVMRAALRDKEKAEIPNVTGKDALRLSITEIGLTTRSVNCLKNDGVATVLDLVRKSKVEIGMMPNLGVESFMDIHRALVRLGLRSGSANSITVMTQCRKRKASQKAAWAQLGTYLD